MTSLRWLLLGLLGAPIALAPVVRTTIELERSDDESAAKDTPSAPDAPGTPDDPGRDGEPENIAVPSVFLKPAARADTEQEFAFDGDGADGEGADGDDSAGAATTRAPRATHPASLLSPGRADAGAAARRALVRAGRRGVPPPLAA